MENGNHQSNTKKQQDIIGNKDYSKYSAQEIKKLRKKIAHLENTLAEKEKVIQRLDTINLNELSPKLAFDILWEIKNEENFSEY